MRSKTCALILAGGEGKRMKSNRPKVLAEVLFKPLLRWVIDAVREAGIEDICVVTGSRREYVDAYLQALDFPVETVFQAERLGTGHAVMMAEDFLRRHGGEDVVILNGDAPFISPHTIRAALIAGRHSACTVITAEVENPTGYGRIVRQENGVLLQAIVEEKEATDEIRQIREINSGTYRFSTDVLLDALGKIVPSARTGEYYLTDTVEIIKNSGGSVLAFKAENADSVLGANDCKQLSQLNEIARLRVLERHQLSGVSIPCTDGVIIGTEVEIGANTVILPSTVICGETTIGSFCRIGPAALLENCHISDGVSLACGSYRGEAITE